MFLLMISWTKLLVCSFCWAGVADELGAASPVPMWQAVPVRLQEVRGTQRRSLDRLERFLKQEQWDEAFEIAARLLQAEENVVVSLTDRRFISLQEYCHRLLSQLPPKPLARYRELVDAPSEAIFQRGYSARNEVLLKRVVEEYFCSSWGDDALWALGELALESGDYAQARGYWQCLLPNSATSDSWLSFPQSEIDIADVHARLILVSIREGNWQKAKQELSELKRLYPLARGRLGGREVVYAEFLAMLLNQPQIGKQLVEDQDWPTFAGGRNRTSVAHSDARNYNYQFSVPLQAVPHSFPVVHDRQLIYQDALGIHVFDLFSGEVSFVLQHEVIASSENTDLGQACLSLTASRNHVFGATKNSLGTPRPKNVQPSTLWAVDLRREGALAFKASTTSQDFSFAGAPLVNDGKAYVAIRRNGRNAHIGIACYSIASGKQLWQHWLCQANTPATRWSRDVVTALLTMDAGRIYLVTNLGAVVAVRAVDGRVLWARSYNRIAEPLTVAAKSTYYCGPNPGVYYHGKLFALPTDSQKLLVLDAVTGTLDWSFALSSDKALLVGAVAGKLILSDAGLKILDVQTGELMLESRDLPLHGRAVVTRESILWPSAGKIHLLDLESGLSDNTSLSLPYDSPVNLILARDFLIAAQPEALTIFRSHPHATAKTSVSQFP